MFKCINAYGEREYKKIVKLFFTLTKVFLPNFRSSRTVNKRQRHKVLYIPKPLNITLCKYIYDS